jgi:hypothetical protein
VVAAGAADRLIQGHGSVTLGRRGIGRDTAAEACRPPAWSRDVKDDIELVTNG